jgi:hypothetical protein
VAATQLGHHQAQGQMTSKNVFNDELTIAAIAEAEAEAEAVVNSDKVKGYFEVLFDELFVLFCVCPTQWSTQCVC